MFSGIEIGFVNECVYIEYFDLLAVEGYHAIRFEFRQEPDHRFCGCTHNIGEVFTLKGNIDHIAALTFEAIGFF